MIFKKYLKKEYESLKFKIKLIKSILKKVTIDPKNVSNRLVFHEFNMVNVSF